MSDNNDIDKLIKAIEKLESGEIYNTVALTMHQQIKKRIFTKGENAKNKKIGRYAASTLRTRSSRKNKGKVPQSRFIILEFTGQMRRDFAPIKDKGVIVGSGFKQKINDKKVIWVEKRLRQKIFELSKKEKKQFENLLQKQVNKILK